MTEHDPSRSQTSSDGGAPPRSPSHSQDEEGPRTAESLQLVRLYKKGDRSALDRLLERYQDRIRRIVRIQLSSRLRKEVETMDLVQEVNLVAMRKFEDFEPADHASILNWLCTIALNKIREANDFFYGAQKRDRGRVVALDAPVGRSDAGLEISDDDPGQLPEERVWREELRTLMDECMTRLPDAYRETILLRDYFGLPWEDVAEETGRPTVHAAQEMHRRAWIRLRRMIRPRLRGIA